MGGGDLNMKKSWHPVLIKNQEKVWKEEKKALEERKRTQQLQKELAEERAVQELQRLQGQPTEKKIDWMYATPAQGGGMDESEMEAYLLGKKRVDKFFREQEAKVSKDASSSAAPSGGSDSAAKGQSYGNANNGLDTAAKIREDPLLLIKKQEQAAYEALMKNPKRLKAMKDAQKKDKGKGNDHGEESKEERKERRKREKEEKRERKEGKRQHRDYGKGREGDDYIALDDHYDQRRERDRRVDRHDDRSRHPDRRPRRDYSRSPSPPRRRRSLSPRRNNGDRNGFNDDRDRRASYSRRRSPSYSPPLRSPSPPRRRRPEHSLSPEPTRRSPHRPEPRDRALSSTRAPLPPPPSADPEAAAKRLAAMTSAAKNLSSSRSAHIAEIEAKEQAEAEAEEAKRGKARKDGDRKGFLKDQEMMIYGGGKGANGMDLGDRLKSMGGRGLQRDRDWE